VEQGQPEVKQLLTQANLARVRGNWAQAESLLQQVLGVTPGNPEALELLGDACYQQGKGSQAINYYRQAHQRNPGKLSLEDKIGRASLLIARQEAMLAAPELFLEEGARRQRKPALAALFSFVLPGLGQLYNGERLKGALLVIAWLVVVLNYLQASAVALGTLVRSGVRGVDPTRIINLFFSGWPLVFGLLLAAVWAYAIADAGYMANQRTHTHDSILPEA